MKALSDELRLEHHGIEWRDIIALRSIIVRNYDRLYYGTHFGNYHSGRSGAS
jgi:uncharacterized protein with HEPN domain